MIYRIAYDGDKLTSTDGYQWRAEDSVDEVARMSADIVNAYIDKANHHDPIAVILERLGDSVQVESLPNDSSNDTQQVSIS